MFCIMRHSPKIEYFIGFRYRDNLEVYELWDTGKLTIYDTLEEAKYVLSELSDTASIFTVSIQTVTIGL